MMTTSHLASSSNTASVDQERKRAPISAPRAEGRVGEVVVAVVCEHCNVLRSQLSDQIECLTDVPLDGVRRREQLAEDHGIGIAKTLQLGAAVRARAEVSHLAVHTRPRQ